MSPARRSASTAGDTSVPPDPGRPSWPRLDGLPQSAPERSTLTYGEVALDYSLWPFQRFKSKGRDPSPTSWRIDDEVRAAAIATGG
jgi:hypothetical protein